MLKQQIIKCAFCQGTGKHTHFGNTCPVCKGRGENQIRGKFVTCRDCRGSGQKRGTTLTCYTCAGLGIVPDTTEIFKKAKEEIKEAREEMDKERQELGGKIQSPLPEKRPKKKRKALQGRSEDKERIFCQCCGNKVEKNSTVKVCIDCVIKIKEV